MVVVSTTNRPAVPEEFDRIVGIKSMYQYFMLKTGEVLGRPRSCWCIGCLAAALGGPGAATKFTSNYDVKACLHYRPPHPPLLLSSPTTSDFYNWNNYACGKKKGDISKRETAIVEHGHKLGGLVQEGDWLLFEAFHDGGDLMWLAKAVPFPHKPDFFQSKPDSCSLQYTGATHTTKFKTRFDPDDYMIAVQMYERPSHCGDERREFVIGVEQVDVINSTELRSSKFTMT